MSLTKSLPRIAAKVLHNTHCFPKNMKEKFELIETAYGRAAVESDFELWCREIQEKNPRYPITEYMKIVDSRLGRGFADAHADLKDPRIAEVSSLAYELTGVLPSSRSVANLLVSFDAEEIKAALREYSSTLDDKEMKSGMRTFFTEGGATAVIYTRKKRKEKSLTEEKF